MTSQEYYRLNKLSNIVIGAAIEVHKTLGPGLLEAVYEECLKTELMSKGIRVECQVSLPLIYKGIVTSKEFRIDMLVEDELIIELKAVDEIKEIYEFQLLTYLKLTNKSMGLLINFNVPLLRDGIRRKINGYVNDAVQS